MLKGKFKTHPTFYEVILLSLLVLSSEVQLVHHLDQLCWVTFFPQHKATRLGGLLHNGNTLAAQINRTSKDWKRMMVSILSSKAQFPNFPDLLKPTKGLQHGGQEIVLLHKLPTCGSILDTWYLPTGLVVHRVGQIGFSWQPSPFPQRSKKSHSKKQRLWDSYKNDRYVPLQRSLQWPCWLWNEDLGVAQTILSPCISLHIGTGFLHSPVASHILHSDLEIDLLVQSLSNWKKAFQVICLISWFWLLDQFHLYKGSFQVLKRAVDLKSKAPNSCKGINEVCTLGD